MVRVGRARIAPEMLRDEEATPEGLAEQVQLHREPGNRDEGEEGEARDCDRALHPIQEVAAQDQEEAHRRARQDNRRGPLGESGERQRGPKPQHPAPGAGLHLRAEESEERPGEEEDEGHVRRRRSTKDHGILQAGGHQKGNQAGESQAAIGTGEEERHQHERRGQQRRGKARAQLADPDDVRGC